MPFSLVLAQIPSSINYNESNGLPSNEAYHVYQDPEGFIWISTDNGVVKFDGLNFDLFNKQNGLADNVNFSFHNDSHNRLWLRSFTGALSIIHDDSIYHYPLNKIIQQYLDKSIILSLSIDSYDSLHIGMYGVMLSIDSSGHYKATEIPNYSLMVKSTEGSDPLILYKNAPGLLKQLIFDGQSQELMTYDGSANVGVVGAKKLKGKTYAFNDRYLFEIGPTSNKVVLKSSRPIISLSVDRSGKMWVGLQSGGLLCFDQGQSVNPNYFSSLREYSVTSVLLDENNGYWISTLEKGVFYFPNVSILNYLYPSNSKLNAVAFSEDAVYFGNYDGSLYRFSLNQKSFELIRQFGSPIISLFYNSKKKNLFISTSANTYILDLRTQKYFSEGELSIRGIKNFQENNGKIIGGNLIGLFEFDYSGVLLSMKRTPTKIRSFLIDGNDVYLASTSGLIKTNLALNPFDTVAELNNNKILDIMSAPKGVLLATAESGVLLLRGDSIRPYYLESFPCPLVRKIYTDDKFLYLATQCGLIIDGLDQESFEHPLQIVNTRMGLLNPNIEYVGYVGHTLLSFSPDGISVMDTAGWRRAGSSAKFFLKRILVNNNMVKSIPGSLSYKQNNLEFRYGIISFNTRNIRVRHRPGPAFEWSDGNVSQLNYNSLSPGNYQPELAYSIDGGPWQSVKLVDSFSIAKPWWESIYFQATAIILIASLIGLIFYAFYLRKISHVKFKESLRSEKDRISRELHDNIGAKLAYLKLSMYNLEQENNFHSKKELIQSQLSSTVHELRDTIWAINQDTVSLQDFAYRVNNMVARFKQVNIDVRYQFHGNNDNLNPTLSPALAINLYRIIQEALNNCIKHSGAENIKVSIRLDETDKLIVIVHDNGVGFDLQKVNNIDGYGLQSMKARAEESQIKLQIKSTSEVGTEVIATFDIS